MRPIHDVAQFAVEVNRSQHLGVTFPVRVLINPFSSAKGNQAFRLQILVKCAIERVLPVYM